MKKEFWLVGQVVSGSWDFRKVEWKNDYAWEVNGIFESEEKAVDVCRDENYFVMPLELNKSLPHEKVEIDRAYYPKKENVKA